MTLKTSDAWTLSARWRSVKGNLAAVLLHGLGAGKEEWGALEAELARRGISTLSVDLRGHGGGQGRSWQTFLDHGPQSEWLRMWEDARAAYLWLQKRGYKRIGFVGASLGANAGLMAAARIPGVAYVALLSPGLDYQAVRTEETVVAYARRPLLLACAPDDLYAYHSALALKGLRDAAKLPVDFIEGTSGHGVHMFRDAGTLERIASWILAQARAEAGVRPR